MPQNEARWVTQTGPIGVFPALPLAFGLTKRFVKSPRDQVASEVVERCNRQSAIRLPNNVTIELLLHLPPPLKTKQNKKP